jgi:hypothetical protein
MLTRRHKSPGSRLRSMFVLLLALSPACCATTPPPPEPAAPAPEVLGPPAPPAVRPVLHAAWSFHTEPDACIAVARASAASLQIAVRREGLIRLTMSLPGDAPAKPVVRFNGPAGRWMIPGTPAGRRQDLFTLARNETSLSRILVLLSGGTLDLQPPGEDLPILSLPESGANGQQWFACVRRIVNWT